MPKLHSKFSPRELLMLQNGITAGLAIAAGLVGACARTPALSLARALEALANEDGAARAIAESLMAGAPDSDPAEIRRRHAAIVKRLIELVPADLKRGLHVAPYPYPEDEKDPNAS